MVRRIKARTYIHERKGGPGFYWDGARTAARLVDIRHRQGRLIGRIEGLGFQLREEAVLNTLTEDVLKSSEIEGETLDRDRVRSSIARRLGIDIGGLTPADRPKAYAPCAKLSRPRRRAYRPSFMRTRMRRWVQRCG